MKNVFIVGGAGFVGSHLICRLLAMAGVKTVTVYDNLSSGRMENVPLGDIRVTFVNANARDIDRLRVEMAGHDTVFHLASNPDIARAVKEPTIDFEQGTVLTQNVLEAARINGVKRLIYFSGSGVYGDVRDTLVEDYGPMEPISTYGASKLAGEAMTCAYCHMFGMVARAFRFANIVGPRQTHGVGFDFLRKLWKDPAKLTILGDGTQTKSYIHIDDVLNAVLLVCERCLADEVEALTPYAVYNVATMDTLSVAQIAQLAVSVMRIAPDSVKLEYSGGDRGWKGDVPKVHFNSARIRSLGWKCQRNSVEAMRAALKAMAKELKA